MKKFFKWFLYFLLVGFVIIQFIRIDKTVPVYDTGGDFLAVNRPEQKVGDMLKNACYDCHSFETKYPWYAEIAPFSWWIGDHIEEGREHVNFSLWSSYSAEDKSEIIEESVEEIEEGKMPDPNYIKMHAEAKMSEADERLLTGYLKSVVGGSMVHGHDEDNETDED